MDYITIHADTVELFAKVLTENEMKGFRMQGSPVSFNGQLIAVMSKMRPKQKNPAT